MRRHRRVNDPAVIYVEKRRGAGPIRLLTLLLIAAVAAAILFATGIIRLPGRSSPRVEAFELKNIGELATQAGYFTIVQTIELSRKVLITIPGSTETYVFSYDGIVKAGMDFADIDVKVDDRAHQIRIRLPEIRILSVELDEDSFQQYSGGGNLLSQLTPAEVNEGREKVKEKARETAINNGILENARENAQVLIREFLSGGYDLNVYEIIYE